ncbi:MAG: hypothetical protein II569_07570 [Paludibacteraceae bacterium]|nr:hypothetical protein [Paludibacteraceae bacterium]
MFNTRNAIITIAVSMFATSVSAQLFGSDRTPKASNKHKYEVKSNARGNVSRPVVAHDGFAPDTTENESKGMKKLTELFKKNDNKTQPKSSNANNPSVNRNVALAKNRRNPALDNKFIFRGFALNGIVNVESLKADTTPPAGFKEYITDMRFYEEGEDLRLIDNSGLHVTMLFEPGTSRLTGVQVENVDRMDQVQQLQQLIKKEMGVPTRGYEVIRNYDGDNNSVWTDYSTYEFVYQYDYGDVIYDFHISQYGAKKSNGKIMHPYDFLATVTIPKEEPAPAAEQSRESNDAKTGETDKSKLDKFYPKEGIQRHGNYTVEVKLLAWW